LKYLADKMGYLDLWWGEIEFLSQLENLIVLWACWVDCVIAVMQEATIRCVNCGLEVLFLGSRGFLAL